MSNLYQGCQWIGEDQDARRHSPIKFCGCAVVEGKSYCAEHYPKVYQVGTSNRQGRSASRSKKTTTVMTAAEITDLMNEVLAELEAEGVL